MVGGSSPCPMTTGCGLVELFLENNNPYSVRLTPLIMAIVVFYFFTDQINDIGSKMSV